jgi:hypothetical protein
MLGGIAMDFHSECQKEQWNAKGHFFCSTLQKVGGPAGIKAVQVKGSDDSGWQDMS